MSDQSVIRGALPEGTILDGRYTIERTLGRGGFAITYLCRSGAFDKYSAVKEFMPASLAHREPDGTIHPISSDDAEFFDNGLADFWGEGLRLTSCQHSNIVKVEDHFRENGSAYLVMEYIEGPTLYDYLLNAGSLDLADCIKLMRPILDALRVVHSQGLLHRDLTPNNIILRDGIADPVLIDFGAARHATGLRTASIAHVISDGYAPPEQYQQLEDQQPAVDVYAIGSVLYRCITSERPPRSIDRFNRDIIASLPDRFNGNALNLLMPKIMKALSLEPEDRQQSAEELLAEFDVIARILAILGQLDGEADDKQPTEAGLFWKLATPTTIELHGTLETADQFERLAREIHDIEPEMSVLNQTEFLTTPASSSAWPEATLQVPVSPQPSVSTDAAPSQPVEDEPTAAAPAGAETTAPSSTISEPASEAVHTPRRGKLAKTLTVAAAIALVVGAMTYFSPSILSGYPLRSSTQNPFNVAVELSKTSYDIGERFSFTVSATKECNFSVHTIDAAGAHKVHNPEVMAQFMGPQPLAAGEVRRIPVEGAPGHAEIEGPPGEYQVFAVCGRDDLAEIGLLNRRLVKAKKNSKRSFKFVVENELSETDRSKLAAASVKYTVK